MKKYFLICLTIFILLFLFMVKIVFPADGWVTPTAIENSCVTATNMIDDDTATGISHYVTEGHYIVFNMGETYTVKKIRMWDNPGYGQVTDISAIYVSNDTGNWGTLVGSYTFPNEVGEVWREIETTDKDGRYIKLITPSEELYYWREFDIYGAGDEEGDGDGEGDGEGKKTHNFKLFFRKRVELNEW